MGDPRWPQGRDKEILDYRQVGNNPKDLSNIHTEEVRRKETNDIVAAPEKKPVAAAVLPAAFMPPADPNPIIGPDRVHKWGKYYVFVSADHFPGDDPVTNPMYAPSGSASTIADGYVKAKALAALYSATGERCALVISGGIYTENITFDSSLVDVVGEGRPVIKGHSIIPATVTRALFEGIEFWTSDSTQAVAIPAQATAGADGLGQEISNIRFIDCWIHGNGCAWYSQRRFFMDRCIVWSDTATYGATPPNFATVMNPTSTMWVEGSSHDSWFSIVQRSTIMVYSAFPPSANVRDVAIHASSKINGLVYDPTKYTQDISLRGPRYYTLDHSGLILDDCYVYGTLLNDGWSVIHRGGAQHARVYAIQRGWSFLDTFAFVQSQIPADTYFDNTLIHSTSIAEFVADPAQNGAPNSFAGAVYIRNTGHLAKWSGVAASPFGFTSGVAEAYIANSFTASTSWTAASVTEIIYNSLEDAGVVNVGTGAGILAKVLFSPYYI